MAAWLFRNKKPSEVDAFLALTAELAARLEFAERRLARLARLDEAFPRHITLQMGDLEPLGRRTMVLAAVRGWRRRWWAVALGLAVLLLGLAGAAVVVWSRRAGLR